MGRVILIFIVVFLSGCKEQTRDYHTTRVVCDKSTVDNRANFTLKCIENANPRSDEEPEDWIYKCENMAKELYCEDVPVIIHQRSPAWKNYWIETGVTIK